MLALNPVCVLVLPESLGPAALTPEMIDRCGPVVAQMGVEPFIKALDAGAEVIIAGRACDDVIFAALPIMKGYDRGLALHCGKILECAGLSAVPCDLAEPLIGRLREDHFEVEPCHPAHRCTTISVAGHSLYERGDPCLQPGPGGMNDLTHTVYTQVDERCVCDQSPTGACNGPAHCAPENSERRWCMKKCSHNHDCRNLYECRSTGTYGAEPIPSLENASGAQATFCVSTGQPT